MMSALMSLHLHFEMKKPLQLADAKSQIAKYQILQLFTLHSIYFHDTKFWFIDGGRYYLLMLVARESEIAISQCMFCLQP